MSTQQHTVDTGWTVWHRFFCSISMVSRLVEMLFWPLQPWFSCHHFCRGVSRCFEGEEHSKDECPLCMDFLELIWVNTLNVVWVPRYISNFGQIHHALWYLLPLSTQALRLWEKGTSSLVAKLRSSRRPWNEDSFSWFLSFESGRWSPWRDDTGKKNYAPWKKNSRSLEKIFTAPGKEI